MAIGPCVWGIQSSWHTGLVALRHVGSSPTRDWTHVPCIGRWTLNQWTTREVIWMVLYTFYPSWLFSYSIKHSLEICLESSIVWFIIVGHLGCFQFTFFVPVTNNVLMTIFIHKSLSESMNIVLVDSPMEGLPCTPNAKILHSPYWRLRFNPWSGT